MPLTSNMDGRKGNPNPNHTNSDLERLPAKLWEMAGIRKDNRYSKLSVCT